MSDLIDRQAAIDVVRNCNVKEVTPAYMLIDKAETMTELMMLSPVESERKIELEGDESPVEILSELRSWFSCFDEKEGLVYHTLTLAINAIKRKKGQWIGIDQFANSPEFYSWKCSVCGCVLEDPTLDKPYSFCPNCGSQNAEEEGEQE